MTMKKTLRAAGLAGFLATTLFTSAAHALVTDWGYNITSSFSAATFTSGSPFAGSANSLSWGDGAQSSLVIGNNSATGSVQTYLGGGLPPAAAPYLGFSTSLTHNNKPITGQSLKTATLTNTVNLTSSSGGFAQVVPFQIMFAETTNSTPCAVTGSPTPCNDIFVLSSGLLNFAFQYDDDANGVFDTYFVNIFPVTGGVLNILPAGVCAAADAGSGCVGFTTPENANTTLRFGFTISSEPLSVPEPGILGLLGLGLLGAFVSRRQSSRKAG